jgi:hypothetical protein
MFRRKSGRGEGGGRADALAIRSKSGRLSGRVMKQRLAILGKLAELDEPRGRIAFKALNGRGSNASK